jgi:hypothetical protein
MAAKLCVRQMLSAYRESVTIKIGGTLRSRFLATLAVLHELRLLFSLAISAWLVMGAMFGKAVLATEAAGFLLGVYILVNTLGISPGELLIRGSITFTPGRVCQSAWWGRTYERGWKWVIGAEETLGELHIAFSRIPSRGVVSRLLNGSEDYLLLREMLVTQRKLRWPV